MSGDAELIFGLLAFVLVASSLISGIVDRVPLSLPVVFLGVGFLLGEQGVGVLTFRPESPAVQFLATVSLSLTLFLDALKLDVDEVRRDWRVPLLSIGPGAALVILGVGVASHALLGTTPLQSLLLGAALASTDPIVLRDILRDERVPRAVRRALQIEGGTNDVVVLPVVLIVIRILQGRGGGPGYWLVFLAQLLVLSPAVGVIVGGVGAWLMDRIDARASVRREYQALYGLGLVFGAYTAAQALGADGFLAAFFAGLAVDIFNVSLCDCFTDYGEVTAEMAMLLTFIAFGVVLSTLLPTIPTAPAFLLGVVAIFVVRPLSMGLALLPARMSLRGRAFIGWFGPRGLSALLLALLAVEARVPQATRLLAITGMVVVVSLVAHGVTATPVATWYGNAIAHAKRTQEEERASTVGELFERDGQSAPRVTLEELHTWLNGPNPPLVLDVRTRAAYEEAEGSIPGSVRVLPDQAHDWAAQAGKDARTRPVVVYCT